MRGTSPELKRKRDGAICASVRPSWLDPGPSASCGVSITSEQLCHWLNPSAGQQPSRRPPSKHKGRREQRPHWLCAGLGKESSSYVAELGVQRSELSEERNATANVRRIQLDFVSLLMTNSKTSHQTSYQSNGADSGPVRKVLSKGCTCGCMCKLKAVDVITFCTYLHSLSDDAVSHYFHTAYNTCGDAATDIPTQRLRIEWHLLGQRATVKCLQSLLGMIARTFY